MEALFWTFGISSIVILLLGNGYKMQTTFKTLVSKNVAKHGGCTKPPGNNKFV